MFYGHNSGLKEQLNLRTVLEIPQVLKRIENLRYIADIGN